MSLKTVSILLLAATLAGCSGKSKSGDDSNGKARISQAGNEALTGQTAIFEASKNQGGGQVAHGISRFNMKLDSVASVSPSSVQKKTVLVSQALTNGACIIKAEPVQSNGSLQGAAAEFPQMKISVKGESCPVQIFLEMKMSGVGGDICQETPKANRCKFIGSVAMTYEILDRKLIEELGVSSGSINMQFDSDETYPGTDGPGENIGFGINKKQKDTIDFKAVDINGDAQLISGSRDMAMDMGMIAGPGQGSLPQMTVEMGESLRYLEQSSGKSVNFLAVVKAMGSEGVERYEIDGAEVTREVYEKERKAFENSMIQFSQDGGGNGGGGQPGPMPGEPGPMPEPGQPFPQPGDGVGEDQTPRPGSGWICLLEDHSSEKLFIGYGNVEFVAKSKAKQACQNDSQNNWCDVTPTCEVQVIGESWYCESKELSSSKVFGGEGVSWLEAKYFATQECMTKSGVESPICQVKRSDCVKQ